MEPHRLNRYQTLFSATCPINGQPINYDLTIVTGEVIMVEALQRHLYGIERGLHEDIADSLWLKFGGHQTLPARHHGVDIKTERSPAIASGLTNRCPAWLEPPATETPTAP